MLPLPRRFTISGVFWRQLHSWGVRNIPEFAEPLIIFGWSLFFFLAWPPGRRKVMFNLGRIFPGSSRFVTAYRTFRVFWNFAVTMTDSKQFHERQLAMDWRVVGQSKLDRLANEEGGAIILTAHMGNYELGAFVFNEAADREITVVRAPERDVESESFEDQRRRAREGERLHIRQNTGGNLLALDLLSALRGGGIVAIQGDRVVPGVTAMPTKLFGCDVDLPSGPFALAMVAQVPLYPLFIARSGWRRYEIVTGDPIRCERVSRDRDADIRPALEQWVTTLEPMIRRHWYQWFTFEKFTAS
jgi:phosphatidylinositol dimannoside acyltransferase